jgi:hypothetical protein
MVMEAALHNTQPHFHYQAACGLLGLVCCSCACWEVIANNSQPSVAKRHANKLKLGTQHLD